MTPREYIAQLGELIGTGRDEDALELAARFGPEVTPLLSPDEFFQVCSLLEGAQLAVDVTQAVRERPQDPGGAPAVRPLNLP